MPRECSGTSDTRQTRWKVGMARGGRGAPRVGEARDEASASYAPSCFTGCVLCGGQDSTVKHLQGERERLDLRQHPRPTRPPRHRHRRQHRDRLRDALALARKGAHVILACRTDEGRGRARADAGGCPRPHRAEPRPRGSGERPGLRRAHRRPARSGPADPQRRRDGPPASTTAGLRAAVRREPPRPLRLTGTVPQLDATEGARSSSCPAPPATVARCASTISSSSDGAKGVAAYGQSKLATSFTPSPAPARRRALHARRRLTRGGRRPTFSAPRRSLRRWARAMQPWQGALPTLRAATDPWRRRTTSAPTASSSQRIPEEDLCEEGPSRRRRLAPWEVSEELTGVLESLWRVKTGAERTRQDTRPRSGQLFLRFGYRKTSMDDIARAAGVSRQALYLWFPNKEALFCAVVDRAQPSARACAPRSFRRARSRTPALRVHRVHGCSWRCPRAPAASRSCSRRARAPGERRASSERLSSRSPTRSRTPGVPTP